MVFLILAMKIPQLKIFENYLRKTSKYNGYVQKRLIVLQLQREPAKSFARKRFGRFKKDHNRCIRTADVKVNRVSDILLERFKGHLQSPSEDYQPEFFSKTLDYDSKDVSEFMLKIPELQQFLQDRTGSINKYTASKLGYFITDLVEHGKDEEYVIPTGHLSFEINDLAYRNSKKLTIVGDAGNLLGREMKSGEIVVTGNAGSHVGAQMESGKITVGGHAGKEVGHKMKGGIIRIKGKAESITPVKAKREMVLAMACVGLGPPFMVSLGMYSAYHDFTALSFAWLTTTTVLFSALISLIAKDPETNYEQTLLQSITKTYGSYHGQVYENGKLVFSRK